MTDPRLRPGHRPTPPDRPDPPPMRHEWKSVPPLTFWLVIGSMFGIVVLFAIPAVMLVKSCIRQF